MFVSGNQHTYILFFNLKTPLPPIVLYLVFTLYTYQYYSQKYQSLKNRYIVKLTMPTLFSQDYKVVFSNNIDFTLL